MRVRVNINVLSRNKIIYDACYPAWSTASQNAKENGTPYGITITTTPNDLNLPQSSFCYEMIQSAAKFDLKCFDMTDEELDDYIEKNSKNNFVYVVYTYKELGRSEEWLQKQIRGLNNDMLKVKRELLLEWPFSNENSVFSEAQLDLLHNSLKDPVCNMNVNNYIFKWYEHPDLKKNYIIGVDVAGGLSKDSSAIVFVNPEDFSIAANFKNNRIDTDNLKKLIQTLMEDYFQNAILVCEKNSYGLNILQSLMKIPFIEPRILQEVKETLAERTLKDGFTVRKKSKTLAYGVNTDAHSRKLMFELLPSIVENEYQLLNCKEIYDDISGLERKKTGKIEHSDNTHDDTLMAYLIVRYSIYYGNYLKNHGISAIPSAKNVRTSMSTDDMIKIQAIIHSANNGDNTIETLEDNPMFRELEQRERYLMAEKRTQADNNLSSFCDIVFD